MVDLNNFQAPESSPTPVHSGSGILTPLLTVSCPLLVIIFVFLFLKFFCRRQTMILPSETSDYTINTAMQKKRQDGIDAKEIERISVEIFVRDNRLDAQCSICLGDLLDGNKVKRLPKCRHVFHPECIDMWLSSHSNCPLCRAFLVSRSVIDPFMIV